MDLENILTDDMFEQERTESTVVPDGHYKLRLIGDGPRVKTSKTSGDRYLTVLASAVATKDGEAVNSKQIYHIVPIEGSDKNGKPKVAMFASFFSALGFEKDEVKALLGSVLETAPAAGATSENGDAASFAIGGEAVTLKGKEFMARLKIDEYNGKEKNVIGSVWAAESSES